MSWLPVWILYFCREISAQHPLTTLSNCLNALELVSFISAALRPTWSSLGCFQVCVYVCVCDWAKPFIPLQLLPQGPAVIRNLLFLKSACKWKHLDIKGGTHWMELCCGGFSPSFVKTMCLCYLSVSALSRNFKDKNPKNSFSGAAELNL